MVILWILCDVLADLGVLSATKRGSCGPRGQQRGPSPAGRVAGSGEPDAPVPRAGGDTDSSKACGREGLMGSPPGLQHVYEPRVCDRID